MNSTIALLAGTMTLGIVSFAKYMDFMSSNKIIGSIITFVGLVLIMSGFWVQIKNIIATKEGLTSLSAGDYPASEEQLILEPWYKAKKPAHLSDQTYAQMSKQRRVLSPTEDNIEIMKSWPIPTDGTCISAGFCGSFYEPNEEEVKDAKLQPPRWDAPHRVNYYEAKI